MLSTALALVPTSVLAAPFLNMTTGGAADFSFNVNFAVQANISGIPVHTSQYLGKLSASNSPTSWSITAGNSAGYFALDNSGNLTLTSTGVTGVTETTYTLTVNAVGSGTLIGTVVANPWPDSTSTGYRFSRTAASSNSFTTADSGIAGSPNVISRKTFTGAVTINGTSYITFQDCFFDSTGGADDIVTIQANSAAGNIIFDHCTLTGVPGGQTPGTVAINNQTSDQVPGSLKVQYCDISNCMTALQTGGNLGPVVWQYNYVHDIAATGTPHYDGFWVGAVYVSLLVQYNTIVNVHGSTDCYFGTTEQGSVTNVTIQNNLFILTAGDDGAGLYTIYMNVDNTSHAPYVNNPMVQNNFLGSGGAGKYFTANWAFVSGQNYDWVTGASVTFP